MINLALLSLFFLQVGADPAAKELSLEVQMAKAKQCKKESRGLSGEARFEAMKKTIVAYRAVAIHWPGVGPIRAEAAFRRGEIHRTLGDRGAARGAFEEALDAGGKTPFGPRALLEIGHLHRRALEIGLAVRYYRQALNFRGVFLRQKNDAREWLSRTWLLAKDGPRAAMWGSRWRANAEDPREEARAGDLEIQAWLLADNFTQAETVWKQLQLRLLPLTQEPTKEAKALASLLARLKGPRLLEEAKSKRESVTIRWLCPPNSLRG